MSHHLKLLTATGMVTSRREGTHIYFRRAQVRGPLGLLVRDLLDAVDATDLSQPLQERIEAVQRERDRNSREFFRANADKFRQQQDLIAGYHQYGEIIVAMLDQIASPRQRDVLEVGPGEGELLPDLCRRYRRVTALDNSAEMLDRARNLATAKALGAIDFVHGDTQSAVHLGLEADVICLNMVLHHTPAPAAVIDDLARVLRPGGSLIVTELCQHHQDWARTACGDLWLGFEPEELSNWAAEAGLEPGLVEYSALRNGFRIQCRQFLKPNNRQTHNDVH
jgi:ArsR family transcriptional regulator